jgi:hypothetical protein
VSGSVAAVAPLHGHAKRFAPCKAFRAMQSVSRHALNAPCTQHSMRHAQRVAVTTQTVSVAVHDAPEPPFGFRVTAPFAVRELCWMHRQLLKPQRALLDAATATKASESFAGCSDSY